MYSFPNDQRSHSPTNGVSKNREEHYQQRKNRKKQIILYQQQFSNFYHIKTFFNYGNIG